MKLYEFITFGSGLVDAFVDTGIEEKKGFIPFPVGAKIKIDEIVFSTGGGGVNSAICLSNLGFKTGFLGKVGKGYNSKIILRELNKQGVDFLGIKGNEHAGYSIILESKEKNRTIITYKGASDDLKYSELELNKLNTKWFYFTSLGGRSFETQEKLIDFAARKKIKIAFNPSNYQTEKGAEYLKKILSNCDILSLNKEEAKMLVKDKELLKGLRYFGPKIVCVTDGKNEGQVYDGEFLYKFYPKKTIIKRVTGAGDIFGSSFVAGIDKFKDVEKAIKLAMVNAENLIKKQGAKDELLSMKEAIKLINTGKFNITKELY